MPKKKRSKGLTSRKGVDAKGYKTNRNQSRSINEPMNETQTTIESTQQSVASLGFVDEVLAASEHFVLPAFLESQTGVAAVQPTQNNEVLLETPTKRRRIILESQTGVAAVQPTQNNEVLSETPTKRRRIIGQTDNELFNYDGVVPGPSTTQDRAEPGPAVVSKIRAPRPKPRDNFDEIRVASPNEIFVDKHRPSTSRQPYKHDFNDSVSDVVIHGIVREESVSVYNKFVVVPVINTNNNERNGQPAEERELSQTAATTATDAVSENETNLHAPGSARETITVDRPETAATVLPNVENEQPLIANIPEMAIDIDEELAILIDEINVLQFDDDFAEIVVEEIPVGDDRERQSQLDNVRQEDALDNQARLNAIERARNRAAQGVNYLKATDVAQAVRQDVGQMNRRCRHCNARYFALETNTKNQYSKCCADGKVVLPPLAAYPPIFQELLRGEHRLSRVFKSKILTYNKLFQFASVEAKFRDIPGFGPFVYAIQGQIYYHFTDINVNRNRFKYGPVYFLDPDEAVRQRTENAGHFDVDRELLRLIGNELQRVNPFAREYRHLHQVWEQQAVNMANRGIQIPRVCLEFVAHHRNRNDREHDLPEVPEVAAVVDYNDGLPPNPRMRVFLTDQDNGFHTIYQQSEFCDPLVFPLLFPGGDLGWRHQTFPLVADRQRGNAQNRRQFVTILQYYAYRLAARYDDNDLNNFDVFRYTGTLNQQFVVAAFLKIENNRMNYLRQNQGRIRSEEYQTLIDYLEQQGEERGAEVGRMVILPSTYITGPRSQLQRYQDAMAVALEVGYPSLFITMTCNPKWPEILQHLPPNDEPSNHPLLICRVFQMKVAKLIEELTVDNVMGVCLAYVYVIEFQKRGLPHAHILITLRNEDKPLDDLRVDQLVSAEIPDADEDPELFELVGKHHIHGPCGFDNPASVCMVDNKCAKKFPKYWYNNTTIRNNKVNFRRRRNGRLIQVRRNNVPYIVDNRYVVPYNPYLLKRYRTHLNIEICASILSIKYLYKYFFKGPDQALIRIVEENGNRAVQYDEIEEFLNGRYMTPPEAAWHIMQMNLHGNSHAVERLSVHLPNRERLNFEPGQEQDAVAREHPTHLKEWFRTNREDPGARQFLFAEFPQHYTWRNNRWHRRARRPNKPIITRLHTVSLRCGELYYLRLLLLHVRGATSFEDVRTVNGEICETFQEACRRRNLLSEDREWVRSLNEASERAMPRQLRQMFAYILVFGEVDDPLALWNQFRQSFLEDFLRRGQNDEEAEMSALRKIQYTLMVNGRRLSDFGLQDPPNFDIDAVDNEPIEIDQEQQGADDMIVRLNEEQRRVFDSVMAAVDNDAEPRRLFFLCGAAGTGKTFLYNTLIANMNARDQRVISVAWTGLAASLLKRGRTVHSTFKLPVPTVDDSVSALSMQSEQANFLRNAKLLIWDEVSMASRAAFNVVDKTLKFVCGNQEPFGGKCVVIGGDFKQCLPVVLDSDRTTVVEACIKSSALWPLFETIRLELNMRVRPDEIEFLNWLDRLGNGTLPTLPYGSRRNIVEIPQQCVISTLDQLIEKIFGDLRPGDVLNRAILTPLNHHCFEINQQIMDRLEGVEKVYYSADSVASDDPEDAHAFPAETLNRINPMGMPPHRLSLKVGVVVMLLRNFNVRANLCNGTRLLIRSLADNYIDAEMLDMNGQLSGERIFIPRIDFRTSDTDGLPFVMKRRQFPVRISYSITVNKSQGQTFDSVGIYLPNPVFVHGQLYVAFSRARSADRVSACVEDSDQQGKLVADSDSVYTKNIVYREVL